MGGDDDDLPFLPEYVVFHVLALLPVKSLLRFKSVCKFWCSLIGSSHFIDHYTATNTNFNSSSSSSKFGNFILHASAWRDVRGYTVLYENTILMLSCGSESSEFESKSKSKSSVSVSKSGSGGGWCWSTGNDSLCDEWNTWESDDYKPMSTWSSLFANEEEEDQSLFAPPEEDKSADKSAEEEEEQVFKVLSNDDDDHEVVFKLDNLRIPSCYKFYKVPKYMVGSCNGVICLYDREHLDVSLWNPATGQFRILPKWITIQNGITIQDGGLRCLVALGFDVETKDYKVVVVICSSPRRHEPGKECLCRVEVYSLSTDSWRLLEGINSLPGIPLFNSSEGVYLNGNCFFMAEGFPYYDPMFSSFIISFSFTKEIFTIIQFPELDEKWAFNLSYLGEKLAVFSIFWHRDDTTQIAQDFDIWVLNQHEHGGTVNKESWTKLHSFQTRTCQWTIPRGISNNGEFALLELKDRDGLSKKMQLYNLVTKEVKKDFLCCNLVLSKAIVYKPSLVSIKSRV